MIGRSGPRVQRGPERMENGDRAIVVRTAFVAAFASRVTGLATGLAAVVLLGFPEGQAIPPPPSGSAILDLPARWDTGWYVGLASGGYRWDGVPGRFENIAFFPGYPLLFGTVARTLGLRSEVAWNWLGILLSTSLFAIALVCLVRLTAFVGDESRAGRAALFCATYPFAIFFGLPYTESMFLLAGTGLFLCFERSAYAAAALFGVMAGLTRPTAVVLTIGLAIEVARRTAVAVRLRRFDAGGAFVQAAAALSPMLGMAVYSAFIHGLTGHPLQWAFVQEGWGRPPQNPVTALLGPLSALLRHPIEMIRASPHVILNAAAGAFSIGLVLPVTRRLGPAYGAVVFMGTLLPLTAGGVASLGRYTAVLFPIYIWMAIALPSRVGTAVAIAFVALQVVVAAMFFTWRPMY